MDSNLHTTPGLGLPAPAAIDGDMTAPPHTDAQHAGVPVPQQPVQQQDDNPDDLDREWVYKAKEIVERTKHDPFMESRELSKVKADYLKTRHNKHLKVGEDA